MRRRKRSVNLAAARAVARIQPFTKELKMATIERSTYAPPGEAGSPVTLKPRYENFIGGHWVAPTSGEYSENRTPATGEPFTEVPRSAPADVELAIDAAHAAQTGWGEASTTTSVRSRTTPTLKSLREPMSQRSRTCTPESRRWRPPPT
jgi:Aldehyde dehydrogenase family